MSGHQKGLARIAELSSLEKLRCHRLKSPNLGFLADMPRLWWLEITLGGTDDLSLVASAVALKHLEIAWVRRATAWFGSDTRERRFDELAAQYGISTRVDVEDYDEFRYE